MKRLPKEGIEKVFKGFGSSSGVKIQDDNLDFSDNNFSMELKIECPDFKIIVPQECAGYIKNKNDWRGYEKLSESQTNQKGKQVLF